MLKMLIVILLFFICLREADFLPTESNCASFHLSIGAASKNITINWSLNCTKQTRPDQIKLFKYQHQIMEIDLKKEKNKGRRDTGIAWNFEKFPGEWYPNNSHPLQKPLICYPYYLKLYKGKKEQDSNCLHVHVNWMSRFKISFKYRIGDLFIPGTYHSNELSEHQNYNMWGQLVFGIRYFDIKVGDTKKQNKKDLLSNELWYVKRFMEMTEKEIVILDFHDFINFQSELEHEWFVKKIKLYLGQWMLTRQLVGNHTNGPLLEMFWETNMRVIVNYRDEEMVKKHNYLWNEVLVKDGKKKTPNELKNYIYRVAKNSYEERMSSLIGVLHSSSPKPDRKAAADKVNPQLSDWYFDDRVKNGVNIFTVDFFESSRLHMDCFRVTKEKTLLY